MVTAEVMAQVEEDAARFRWLSGQPYEVFGQVQNSAHLALRSRMWPEGPNGAEYEAAFDAQIRVEIDKRRARG